MTRTRRFRVCCGKARQLYADRLPGSKSKDAVYALDTTTIDLCFSRFPLASVREAKAAVRLRTALDLHDNIRTCLHITDGKFHDVDRPLWHVQLFIK